MYTDNPIGFQAGLDLYGGVSTRPALRRFADQLWAGNQIYTPSVAFVAWQGPKEQSARVALGLGEATKGNQALYRQPVEAWAKQGSLTVGRFFTPFGQQEWQYETKDGLQWEGAQGPLALTAALQQDPALKRGNLYLRSVYTVHKETQVGLSVAAGKGFTYGSDFDRGMGIEATHASGPWKARLEASQSLARRGERFTFAFGNLSYQLPGPLQPFASYYHWKDTSAQQALGSYHTFIGGVTAAVASGVSVEAATAHDGNKQHAWLQVHFTWQTGKGL